jgi:hypothetical protein
MVQQRTTQRVEGDRLGRGTIHCQEVAGQREEDDGRRGEENIENRLRSCDDNGELVLVNHGAVRKKNV